MVNEGITKNNRRKKQERTDHKKSQTKLDGEGSSNKANNTLLVKLSQENQTWHEYEKSLRVHENTKRTDADTAISDELASKWRSFADDIYRKEIQTYGINDNKDERWVEGTIRKGTLKDRIAAMSVIVSNDPIHKFHAIDGLLQMAGGSTESGGQTNSRVAQLAAEALEDLFVNTLLPSDRKLCALNQRRLPVLLPGKDGELKSKTTLSPRILLLWRFEEMVKEKFDMFIRNYLTRTLREGLEITKLSALRTASHLLRSVPEGESQVLALIVNKLGDPGKKTAAAAGHELRLVLKEHPNMQIVIAREVQQLAHRPHLSSRALYNCVTFLNQLKLDKNDTERSEGSFKKSTPKGNSLPAALICTYFKLFEIAIGGSNSKDRDPSDAHSKSRLLSALLVGVNRARPYLPGSDQSMDVHIDELYRVVHTATPAVSSQALLLLFHITVGSHMDDRHSNPELASTSEEVLARQNRYYRALYAALSSPELVSQGKHTTMFFNLLYKSMKNDNDPARVLAFAKRILTTTMHCSTPAFAASMFMLNEVASHHSQLRAYLEEVPDEECSRVVLDLAKREPRAAMSIHGDGHQKGAHDDGPRQATSWELSLASQHYHPSAMKFARDAGSINYSGNPLNDFSLAPFLDKFAYRNPKAAKHVARHLKRGESVGERRSLRDEDIDSRLTLPVNDPSFIKQKETAVEDDFFRKFFVARAIRSEKVGTVDKKKEKNLDEEEAALDAAEATSFDHSFKNFEMNWDSDSEEEEFVDKLALRLLEDSAGPADVDEDPDMHSWGNLSDDDDPNSDGDSTENSDEDLPLSSPQGHGMSMKGRKRPGSNVGVELRKTRKKIP